MCSKRNLIHSDEQAGSTRRAFTAVAGVAEKRRLAYDDELMSAGAMSHSATAAPALWHGLGDALISSNAAWAASRSGKEMPARSAQLACRMESGQC